MVAGARNHLPSSISKRDDDEPTGKGHLPPNAGRSLCHVSERAGSPAELAAAGN